MSEHETETKVEVKVGGWLPDGTFLGHLVRFTGEELGGYTDYRKARSSDDRGTTYTLYRTPGAEPGDPAPGYRVHVEKWTRWQGEESEAYLWPLWCLDEDGSFYAATLYTEAEARSAFPELFAALGPPNVRDLD